MTAIKVPEGNSRLSPYLILPNAEKFIDFLKKVFDAETKGEIHKDGDRLMHAEMKIGDVVIMFGDSTDQWPAQPAGMFIYVASADETFQKAIDEGATTIMEITDQPYGRTCGVKDPFGNTWWITSL